MRRYTFIRMANQVFEDEDIGIFIGEDLCREAFPYDRPGNLYISNDIPYSISMSLGIAMGTHRRVFVFCDDAYIIRNLSEVAHAAISGLKNLFIVVHRKGIYLDEPELPTIFNSLSNPHGVLFNMGFKVHDYSKSFDNQRNPLKELKAVWGTAVGPLVVLMTFSKGSKVFKDVPLTNEQSIYRLKHFMQTEVSDGSKDVLNLAVLGE